MIALTKLLAIALCLAITAGQTIQSISNDSALLWDFRFEAGDVTGTSLRNYAKGGPAATLVGSPGLSTGSPSALGSGNLVLSSYGQYMTFPSISTGGGAFTISVWLKINPSTNNGGQWYCSVFNFFTSTTYSNGAGSPYQCTSGSKGIHINLTPQNGFYFEGDYFQGSGGACSGAVLVDLSSYINSQSWVHVAMTFGNVARPQYYINGVLFSTASSFNPITTSVTFTNIFAFTSPWTNFERFVGAADDVRLYKRQLSAAEILALAAKSPNYFAFTGAPQTLSVPSSTVALQIEACGGMGGSDQNNGFYGGYGGYVLATLPLPTAGLVSLSPGTVQLYVYVGGWGRNSVQSSSPNDPCWTTFGGGAFNSRVSGGGGTDVRTLYGSSDGSANLVSRLAVAGGGGGGLYADGYGGLGGGLTGGSGRYSNNDYNGYGGTQLAGGNVCNCCPCTCGQGVLGRGGACGDAGGGGGYYGGGSGRVSSGGGSSYVTAGGSFVKNTQGDARCNGNGWMIVTAVGAPSAAPTPIPPPVASPRPSPVFREYTQADFLWTSFHNGPHCNSTAVGFAIRAFSLQQCLPNNDPATQFHPYIQRCFVGKTGVSIIRDTYPDYSCAQAPDARAKGKGVVFKTEMCSPTRAGFSGKSQRARCDKLPPSLAVRDMVVLQSFMRPDCSGGVTGSGDNPEIIAVFLGTCALVSLSPALQFHRKLIYVSGDAVSSPLVLTEQRFSKSDRRCAGAVTNQNVVVLPLADGAGACIADPLHPGRFYFNVYRTLDYSSAASVRDWNMQPQWSAPSPRPTIAVTPAPTPTPPFVVTASTNGVVSTSVTRDGSFLYTLGVVPGADTTATTQATFTITASAGGYADVLLVGGGGGGGRWGAGGGAGQMLTTSAVLQPGTTYTIKVGNGGPAQKYQNVPNTFKGGDSSLSGGTLATKVAYGGSGGSGHNAKNGNANAIESSAYSTGNYGSGGGGWRNDNILAHAPAGPTCTSPGLFCNDGGRGGGVTNYQELSGGGGGAGGPGQSALTLVTTCGAGGAGMTWSWTGATIYAAGGGGGGGGVGGTLGGAGGSNGVGGAGGSSTSTGSLNIHGGNGAMGTGSGGGGGSYIYPASTGALVGQPGDGGSGVVVLHFYGPNTPSPPPTAAPSRPTAVPSPRPTPVPSTFFPTNAAQWAYYTVPVYNALNIYVTAAYWATGQLYFIASSVTGYPNCPGCVFAITDGVAVPFMPLAGSQSVCGMAVDQTNGDVYMSANNNVLLQMVKITAAGVVTVLATAPSASADWCGNIKLDSNVPPNIYMSSYKEDGSGWGTPKMMTQAGVVSRIGGNGYNGGGWGRPNDLVVDAAGNVFVAEMRWHRISKIAAGTGAVSLVSVPCISTTFPTGISIDAAGALYISLDDGVGRFVKYNPSTGACSVFFGRGDGPCSGGGCAVDITVNPAGTIVYASDYMNRGNSPDRLWEMFHA